MLQVKRIGHATLTTPDLERQLDYYTRVVGLSAVAKEKGRVILATKPGQQAIVFTDPKGTSVEIFSNYTFAKDDDNYTGVMPRKLGHVAFHTPDVAATVKFYCDVLGFKVSDWRSDFFAFLRCSRDHHTITLLQ